MLFDEMVIAPPEDKLAPNQFTYNALISVLTHSGCLEMAALKFREMQEVNREHYRIFSLVLGGGGGDESGAALASMVTDVLDMANCFLDFLFNLYSRLDF